MALPYSRRSAFIASTVVALVLLFVLAVQYFGDKRAEGHYLNSDEITDSTLERGGAKDDTLLGLGWQACRVAGIPHSELPQDENGQPVDHFVAFRDYDLQLGLSDGDARAVWVAAIRELCPGR